MEDQQGRMMLYPQQNYGMGGMVGGEESLATSPASAQGDESQQQRQHADINTILDQIMAVTDQSLDEARKHTLNCHRMKPALFSVLCEIKEKTVINIRNCNDEDPPDPQLMRLDNVRMGDVNQFVPETQLKLHEGTIIIESYL